jgi:hypothetical protein
MMRDQLSNPVPKGGDRQRCVASLPLFLAIVICATSPMAKGQGGSPTEVLDKFCKLDAEGKRLTLQGAKEVAPLLAEQNSWTPNSEITIIKDYLVRPSDGRTSATDVTVGYNVWGRLDSSLRFTPIGGAFSNRPTLLSEHFTLVRSNASAEPPANIQSTEAQGSVEWKIRRAPPTPNISVGAAIGYLGNAVHQSKDPLLRINAQRSLAELQKLYRWQALPMPWAQPSQQSPLVVLSQFVALETDGRGLTPDGLEQFQSLVVQPPSWRRDRIHVARSYVVKGGAPSENRADLYVEYSAIGELDSSLGFTGVGSDQATVREEYTLVFDNKYTLAAYGRAPARELLGPNRWRIQTVPPEQWITVNAAIRYVTQMREAATDPVARDNAEKTIATLSRYR